MTDDQNLQNLQERIRNAEEARAKKSKVKKNRAQMPTEGVALAGRIATELVAGIIVGGGVGWGLDKWLGTLPLFMIICLFLGAAAGMMNIWRMASGHGLKIGYFDEENNEKNGTPPPHTKSCAKNSENSENNTSNKASDDDKRG